MKKVFILPVLLLLIGTLSMSCLSGGEAAPAEKAEITLRAIYAELTTTSELQIEAENQNVGWWSDLNDQVKWTTEIPNKGTYSVQIVYSVDESFAGSVVDVTIGDSQLEWEVASTTEWTNYQAADLGTVELSAGMTPVILKAKSIQDRFVANVQMIILKQM